MLVALDAKYIHTNLAVRSIRDWAERAGIEGIQIAEYSINHRPDDILADLAAQQAGCYLFSCYIWNIELIRWLARQLRRLLPEAAIVAGGPEVSYRCAEFLQQNPAFDGGVRLSKNYRFSSSLSIETTLSIEC